MVKKRVLSIVICASLLAGMLTGCAGADFATGLSEGIIRGYAEGLGVELTSNVLVEEAEQKELPKEGEIIEGFTVKGLFDFPEKKGVLVDFEHEKSGAKLLYLANDDTDLEFKAFYRTNCQNDNGIPHIFEHITLSGSGKYPNASLWDRIAGTTYLTNINASTDRQMTCYFFSSMSEDQLLAVADFYMDGLTDPIALRDPRPLGREAYRLQLYRPEDEISVTGAVFNEMESFNSDIDHFSENQTLKIIYPDSAMSYSSGGQRESIINTTLDELKEFYGTYYHPSNMLITLYGDMNYARVLKFLNDNYLSKYDKRDIEITDSQYKSYEGLKEEIVYFPAPEGSEVKNQSIIKYVISLGDISLYDDYYFNVIASLLSSEGNPIKERIKKEIPGCEFKCSTIDYIKIPVFDFELYNADPENADLFRSIVSEELNKIVSDGINKEMLEGFINKTIADNLIQADEPGVGIFSTLLGLYWSLSGDELAYFDCSRAKENLVAEVENGKFESLMADYLVEPKQAALVSTVPKPGLYEEEYAKFSDRLHAMKEAMTEEEIDSLIASTLAFDEWSTNDFMQAQDYMDYFNAVEIKDLPENVQIAKVDDNTDNGIHTLSSVIDDLGYTYSCQLFDAGMIPVDSIYDFQLLATLLGNLPTDKYSASELSTVMDKDIYNYTIDTNVLYDSQSGESNPYLSVSFTCLDDKLAKSHEYLQDILSKTDFTAVDVARQVITKSYLEMKRDYSFYPYNIAISEARAIMDENAKYENEIRGLNYYNYIKGIKDLSDEDLLAKLNQLKEISDIVITNNDVTSIVVGSDEAIKQNNDIVASYIASLKKAKYQRVDYASEIEKDTSIKAIAVATGESVNSNGYIYANPQEIGFVPLGKYKAVLNFLYSDLYYPEFRYNIGAYGFDCIISDKYLFMSSVRDPELKESFDSFIALPDRLSSMDISDESVENATISAYGRYAYPLSKLDIAKNEINYILTNRPMSYSDAILENMRGVKSITKEDIINSKELLKDFYDNGIMFSCGNSVVINENKDMFDIVYRDLLQ